MITGNEPAHPFESATENDLLNTHLTGLSIRQYYAGLAMQGILSTLSNKEALKILAIGMKATKEELQHAEVIVARASLQHADALIAELNKQTV